MNDLKRYRLGPKLGQGSYGRVHQITDTTSNLTYVAKFIKPQSTLDIQSEINILYKLSNKCRNNHLLCYIDSAIFLDKQTGLIKSIVLITDTITNSIPLNMYLLKTKPISFSNPDTKQLSDSLFIMYQLTVALSTLHNKFNITHLDIKPNNIIINPQTLSLMLIDFGISCDKSVCATSGTPGYLSPEMITQFKYSVIDRSSAKESDVFSLGIVFYQIVVQFSYREYSPFSDITIHRGFRTLSQLQTKLESILKELDFFQTQTKNKTVSKIQFQSH